MRVGVIGASGYTGVELIRLLCRHLGVTLSVVTSRQYAGRPVASVFPILKGQTELKFENPALDELCEMADFFFTAVPHQTAMGIVPKLLAARKKVVDLSADFRIRDATVYEEWYQPHTAREYLEEAVYGLPEIYRSKISRARLIANPGCYPTSVILALAPLLRTRMIDPDSIIVDSKSGASGAGRSATVNTLFCEVTEGFKAYKVAEHRHTPEMEQEISLLSGRNVRILFTPHLLPISRGILSTIYAGLTRALVHKDVSDLYCQAYANESFVRLYDEGELPATQFVRGSNYCDIGFKIDKRTNRIVILSAIDNIGKGAAGQAIQNMNLVAGLKEDMGLNIVPLFP